MEILLNSSLIKNLVPVEGGGTVVTLSNGEDVLIKNTYSDILQKIDAYRLGMSDAQRLEESEKKKVDEKET